MASRIAANVPYVTNAGALRQLDVWAPDTSRALYPAVLVFHGGGHVSGDKNDTQTLALAKALADRGFIVFNANYRLAPGASNQIHWEQENIDIINAATWVKAHGAQYRAKGLPTLGVVGGSAGGTHAATLMTDFAGSGQCQVGACWSGGYDYNDPDTDPTFKQLSNTETWIGCTFAVCPDQYADASPVTHVPPSVTLGPLLLLNSDAEVAPLEQPQAMKAAYDARGAACALIVFPGTRHAFAYLDVGIGPTADHLHSVLGT